MLPGDFSIPGAAPRTNITPKPPLVNQNPKKKVLDIGCYTCYIRGVCNISHERSENVLHLHKDAGWDVA